MPEVLAEAMVAEAGRYLQTELPAGWVARLAARAEHLHGCKRRFQRLLNLAQA